MTDTTIPDAAMPDATMAEGELPYALPFYLEGVARAVGYVLLAYVAGEDETQAEGFAQRLGLSATLWVEEGVEVRGAVLWQYCEQELAELEGTADGLTDNATWHRLCAVRGLNPFECFALALALAVEVDARCDLAVRSLFGGVSLLAALSLFSSTPAESVVWQRLWNERRQRHEGLFTGAQGGSGKAADEMLCLSPVARRWLFGEAPLPAHFSTPPPFTWDDIVLAPKQLAQLQHICAQVAYREVVYDRWGFGSKLTYGRGVRALFTGPAGTGKTMAAQIIADVVGKELYKVSVASLVSKYLGDTEKNLDEVFTRAAQRDCVLFFDEADALFGKRGEQKDSHDRYANMQTSFLLQRFEEHDGIVILATNYSGNLDPAFVRRIQNVVVFTKPQQEQRALIWQGLLVHDAPWEGVDVPFLAGFELTGSEIKNSVLQAAFLAAAQGCSISMKELVAALRLEFEKTGRPKERKAFGKYAHFLEE
jgi:hypothetical protein